MKHAALVELTRLRRGLPVQAVLVHGLFSNAAFWLPGLARLQDVGLALVSIDYAAVLDSGLPLDALARQVDTLVGPGPAHLVTHSFGGVAGLHLGHTFGHTLARPWLSRTFICPTFAAATIDSEAFGAAIAQRTGIDAGSAKPLIAQAIARKAGALPDPRWSAADLVCLPDDDPYFAYAAPPGVACQRYAGGHFDIDAPLAALAARLAR